MTIKERFEAMKKSGADVPRPLELLGELDEKAAMAHLDAKAGASRAEIMEVIAVAKFAKSATVLSSSAQAMDWLSTQAE